jgi:hypothetical protein
MANYRAVANGNWSNLATWQDDSLGYFAASTVLPTSADDVYSNNFTVTIDGIRNARLIANTTFTPPTNLGAMSIPQMSSNTTPSGVAAASSIQTGFEAWRAFDRNTSTTWATNGNNAGWLYYNFPTGKIIKRYGFFTSGTFARNPKDWTFEGSNNASTWTVLDTQTNFALGVSTFYSFDISANITSYTYYRINVTAVQTVGNIVQFAELEMSEITNLYGSITAGGGFTFANGGDLTCTASNGVINRDVGSVYALTFDLPSPNSATLRASTNTAGAVANGRNILVQNTGTFNMVGNYDLSQAAASNRAVIFVNGSTTINIVGNITSSQTGLNASATLWLAAGTPTINITGNVTGGATNNIGFGNGILTTVASTINITGNITTNLTASISVGSGTLNVIGNITGGNTFPAINNITNAATISLLGITTSGSASAAVSGLLGTFVKVRGNVVNTDTYAAILAGRIVIDDNVTSWQFKDSTNTIIRTLYTAGVALGNPATSNVRFGTTYGASGELTGIMRVPSAENVLQGVLVDNTVGTLLMTPAQCWNYLISSGFVANSIGDRLQNASTVATTGGQIASFNI